MNLPNKLTLSRIIVIPFFLFALLFEQIHADPLGVMLFRYCALVLFIAASITDYYDGKIARKLGLTSTFGKLFDPLADKVLMASAFIAFVELRIFPSYLIIIILAREFIITGLRAVGGGKGRVISAGIWGKNKTISQFVTIIAALVFLCGRDTLIYFQKWENYIKGRQWDWWFEFSLDVLLVICVFFTVVSGILYLKGNWDLVNEE